ncbi:hypothetical protein HMPREF1983_00743 [Gemella bergeri ATCC 700627]|uniref:Uncharacterized protein n=1 Tax=Gemella bergeri ATCC 700627 TaxID=1321820 RepID=U2QQ27_9BACL|nr:hypothetical protein [Gemella bergeri]ERK58596.1 hypothetical protein HMPREF1983_00743 [Gemella bergeri ATCC 700627]
MNTPNNKKEELLKKYNLWIKKNMFRFLFGVILYLIILMVNFIFFKNNKVTIFSTLLIFSYTIYIYTLRWFITKHLIGKINNIDF